MLPGSFGSAVAYPRSFLPVSLVRALFFSLSGAGEPQRARSISCDRARFVSLRFGQARTYMSERGICGGEHRPYRLESASARVVGL